MTQNTDETLEDVINDGVMFLKSLTQHYGATRAMEVWDAMNECLGNEVKGRVFFKMISGQSAKVVIFRSAGAAQQGNAVPVIKCIREYAGVTLKEAKDMWEISKQTKVTVNLENANHRKHFVKQLQSLGCKTE